MIITIGVGGVLVWLCYYFFWINRRVIKNVGGVVITGASSGIGEACAIYLDKLGFTVFAGVRQEKDLEKLQKSFAKDKRSKAIFLDVTDPTSIEKAVEKVGSELAKANIGLIGLVNNAGVAANGPLDALPESEIRNVMEVNVFGVLNTTNAFLPLLRQQRKFPNNPDYPQNLATVVHIGSTMGSLSVPFFEAMADAQRLELGESSGIRVCLARLGNIATPIFEKNKIADMKDMKNLNIYQNHLDILPGVTDAITKNAADPIKVAKAVEHALTCAKPKSILRVGWEAWVLPGVWSLIPSILLDRIIVFLFDLIQKLSTFKK